MDNPLLLLNAIAGGLFLAGPTLAGAVYLAVWGWEQGAPARAMKARDKARAQRIARRVRHYRGAL